MTEAQSVTTCEVLRADDGTLVWPVPDACDAEAHLITTKHFWIYACDAHEAAVLAAAVWG